MVKRKKVKSQGRPTHKRTELSAKTIESMAGFGIPVGDIAKAIGVSEPTLRKHYGPELELGQIKANTQVAQSLFRRAMSDAPNAVTAAIFWLKCRAGWREETNGPGKKEAARENAMTAERGSGWEKLLDSGPLQIN